MRIDFEVPLCLDGQIQEPVASHLLKHVLEKGNSDVELSVTRSIKIHGHGDLGLEGIA
jgi:hypothetical protein